jgi:hypothetical protein
LFLAPKALGAIEQQLERGNGALGLRLLEDLGVVGREAIHVQVNAQNAQVNLTNDTLEAAKAVAVAAAMRSSRNRVEPEPRILPEAVHDRSDLSETSQTPYGAE